MKFIFTFFAFTIVTLQYASEGVVSLAIGAFAGAAYTYAVRNEKGDPTQVQYDKISELRCQLFGLDYWEQPVQVMRQAIILDVSYRPVTIWQEVTEQRHVLRSPEEREGNSEERQRVTSVLEAFEREVARRDNSKTKGDRVVDFFTVMAPISILTRMISIVRPPSSFIFGGLVGAAGLVATTEWLSRPNVPQYNPMDTVFNRAFYRVTTGFFGAGLGALGTDFFFS